MRLIFHVWFIQISVRIKQYLKSLKGRSRALDIIYLPTNSNQLSIKYELYLKLKRQNKKMCLCHNLNTDHGPYII